MRPVFWQVRRFLKEFLSDRRVDRDAPVFLVADSAFHHSGPAPQPDRQAICRDLEQGEQ